MFFSHFRINMTTMRVHAEADCFWLILPPFSGWLQKFRNTDIVSLASARGILEPPSVVFSIGMFFDRCTSCKFINWYPDMTI